METRTDYDKQSQDFLDRANVSFAVVLIGSDCPMFCEDKGKGKDLDKVDTYPRKSHIHGKHYRATFGRVNIDAQNANHKTGTFTVDYWNSYADEEHNKLGSPAYRNGETGIMFLGSRNKKRTVKPYDVLTCVQKSDPGTFEDFCADFGYDNDSRKAERVYRAVVEEWRKVRSFFTEAEIEALQEIQ